MDYKEKYLEYIYILEREEEQVEYYLEDLDVADLLIDALVDTREKEVYHFDLLKEVLYD